MNITVRRERGTTATPGTWWMNDGFECYTLERLADDPTNALTPAQEHARIQAGTYPLTLRETYNLRLWTPYPDRMLPHIENVPGREGIEVHSGNSVADILGCLLVGYHRMGETIGASRAALTDLLDRLRAGKGPHQIEIQDPA